MATDATSTHQPQHNASADAFRRAKARAGRAELWLTSLLLFTIVVALYWATPTALNTFDAVSYADQIAHLFPRTGDLHKLFHPHHLLFNAVGYVLWWVAQALGYHGGPLVVLERLNTVLGAAGVVLFYQTLRHLMQRSRWLPFLMALGLSVTFGYWICATDGRVNMPSTVLMLAAFFVLCRRISQPSAHDAALIGLLAGCAVLFHESAGLFVLVGLTGLGIAEQPPLLLPQAAKRNRRKIILTYLGTWSATVLLPYLVVGILGLRLHSPAAFHHWMSSYSELGWWWNFDIPHNLRLDAYALRHAAFVEPPGKQGTFHLSHATPAALLCLYYATLAGWFVAVYAFCAALPLLWRSHQRPVLIVSLVWITLYALFFTVWSPGYFVFWVPVLVPISTLLALSLAHYRARRGGIAVNWLVGLFFTLYGTLNALASIGPHSRPGVSPFQQEARDVHAHTLPGDLIIVTGAGDGAQYEVDIPYFANRDVLSLHTLLTRQHENRDRALALSLNQITQTLDTGRAVYALDEVRHNRRTFDALHRRHPEWGAREMNALFTPYNQSIGWVGPRGKVWRLTPKPHQGT